MFSHEEKKLFEIDHISECYKLHGEYRFYMNFGQDDGAVLVTIRIEEDLRGQYHFSQSHYAHTPDQAGPYVTSRTFEDTPERALSNALDTITSYIDGAIENGHEPKASWLVRSKSFDRD